MKSLDQAVQSANKSFLKSAESLVRFRNLTAFLAGGFGVAFLAETADTAKLVAARLNIVADSEQNLAFLEKQLYDVSVRTRSGYKENAALFTKLAMAGKAYGVSQQTSLTVTENVSKAMKISGASASEAAAATQQLSQAFSSGRLQGDELRSVLENSPRLAQALSTELAGLGVNLGNIREKAKKGEIGINELVKAFGSEKITKQLDDEFSKIPVTIGDALTVAKTKFTQFIGDLDKATGISSAVAGAIVGVANNLDKVAIAAGVAAIAITSQYIPSMVNAIKVSRLFVLINFAAYGRGVASSLSKASGAIGLFNGVLKTSATSTLPAWRQVAGNVFGAISLNASSLFSVFRATLGRIPLVFAAVTAAMYIFNDDTEVISGRLATTNDYIVTGFQIAFEKIGSIVSWIGDKISSVVKFTVDLVIGLIDTMTRAASAAIAFGKSIWDNGLNATVMGGKGFEAMKGGWNNGGVREIFGRAVQGGSWQRRAEERARNRLLGTGLPSLNDPAGAIPADAGGGDGKGGKSGKGNSEIDSIKSALDSLRGSFSDVEKARNDFNDGMETLNKAFRAGIIKADEYKSLMASLAKDVFPGLKNEIKDLADENWKLQREMDGASAGTIKFEEGTKKIKEQIDQIDQIIAKQGDSNGVLKAQRDVLVNQVVEYGRLIQSNEELTKMAEERKKAEEEIGKLVDEASNRLYEMLTNRISDALNFSRNSFKSFWKDVLGMGRDMISSVLGAYVFEPIRKKFRAELEKAFKAPSASSKQTLSDSAIAAVTGSFTRTAANDNGGSVGTGNEEIIVNGSTNFWKEFVNGYKEAWRYSFKDLAALLKPLGSDFKKMFEGLGININELGGALGKMFGGAQIGSQIAGLGKMLGINMSNTGAQIGGAIGSVIPIPGGSIIGSIAGGLLGGLFKKKPSGSTVITGGGEGGYSVSGNKSGVRDNLTSGATTVQEGLNNIAQALGATVGSFRVSIGQYKDWYRVSASGSSSVGSKKYAKKAGSDMIYNGKDLEEATRAAILNAIQDGAIKGIRASTQRLLQAGKDAEAALQDALDFEGVFKKYKEMTDPVGYAMENLGKDFNRLIDLFKKAGASSEEWTQLGKVFQNEITNAIQSSIDQLTAFKEDLIGGSSSYKSPVDRLRIADQKFKDMETKIAAGQYIDQSQFTEAGQALQDLARQVYGSTPEFQAYQQRLLDATNKLISNAEAEKNTLQPVIDAINSQGQAANNNSAATNQLLEQIANNTSGYNPAKNIAVGGGGGNLARWGVDQF